MSDYKNGGVIILDFGSQYTQLIARKIRELNVYSRILSHDSTLDDIMVYKPKAIILSGGPSSVYEKNAPQYDNEILEVDIPILGICYGLHILAHHSGGSNDLGRLATQFHPEVSHTEYGKEMLKNFLFKIASCNADWTPDNFIDQQVDLIREVVGSSNVLIGVSGGVDSSVVAAIMNKAIGDKAIAVLIDHGLMRKNEALDCINALKDGLLILIELVKYIFYKKN